MEVKAIKNQFKLLYTSIYFAIGALTSLLVLHLESIGFTGTQTGLVMAAGSLVLIFSQPFWGIICDKTRKTLMVLRITLIVAGILALVLSVVQSFYLFLFYYCLMHFFQGANAPISDTLAIKASNQLGSNFGALRQYGAIGFAIAVFIVSNVSEHAGLRVIFIFYFIAYLIPALFFHPGIKADDGIRADILSGLKDLIKIPEYRMILMGTFFIFGPVVANNNYFSLLYRHSGGSLAGVGLAFLLFAGSEAPFMKISAKLIDRIGIENTLMMAAATSMIRWFWYGSGPAPEMMLFMFILQGFSVGIYIVSAAQYVAEKSLSSLRVTAMTIYSSAGIGLGGIFCQLAGGVLLDYFNVLAIYIFFGISTVLGMFFLLNVKRRKHKFD
ncbi:MAG: MFS transporter [Tindallia sp. MSAO_Bac2]|nr:MAG: MFS transporter [Tindallia sp. MSAO_Bac2]